MAILLNNKWVLDSLRELSRRGPSGYSGGSVIAAEPLCYAALAFAQYGWDQDAERYRSALAVLQYDDGSVGVRAGEPGPRWPTGLAVLAWLTARSPSGGPTARYEGRIERALAWLLRTYGIAFTADPLVGHDTALRGWPWVEGTHSWVHPTAFALLALKAGGMAHTLRAMEARRLLLNRMLTEGGCNYGNTTVLGRPLPAQIEPTGLALLALAGMEDDTQRIELSLDFLSTALSEHVPAQSLAFGILGLAAHDRTIPNAGAWLERAASTKRAISCVPLTLLCLAALEKRSLMVSLSAVKNE